MSFTVTEQPWGNISGNDITLYHIKNLNGTSIAVTNYGAVIQSIVTKDKNGIFADVVLGYDEFKGYGNDPFYMGCVVGRFANRIAGGKVTIDGQNYQLSLKGDHAFHHHGGIDGFNKKVWQAHAFINEHRAGVILRYFSKDGEEGYPGNLFTTVIYALNEQDEVVIDYYAETDRPTIANLTGHSYFNLSGGHANSIESHYLKLPLNRYLPVNETYIPTGWLLPVQGTAFDFTTERLINESRFNFTEGYDNTWIVDNWNGLSLNPIASLTDPESGRTLDVITTEPSVHVYTGNYLSDEAKGKNNKGHQHHAGICFETQHYPDSPNHPHFPSTLVYPNKPFKSRTIYAFGIKK